VADKNIVIAYWNPYFVDNFMAVDMSVVVMKPSCIRLELIPKTLSFKR